MRKRLAGAAAALAVALLAQAATPQLAAAKGSASLQADGATLLGSPFRYLAIAPGTPGRSTVVERVRRDGGTLDQVWHVPGEYFLPEVAADGGGSALSANGRKLVLDRFARSVPRGRTRLVVLSTARAPRRAGRGLPPRPRRFYRYVTLKGEFAFKGISPDGSIVYLGRTLLPSGFRLRALDVAKGRLYPGPVGPAMRNAGIPVSTASVPGGRWSFTLYDGAGRRAPFLEALETVGCRAVNIALPGLAREVPRQILIRARLRLREEGEELALLAPPDPEGGRRTLVKLDVENLETREGGCRARRRGRGTAAQEDFLSFAFTPRRPDNLVTRAGVAGRSVEGRPIELRQYGDPALAGELLVFGCVHGDECAASDLRPLAAGCPDPLSDIYVVPNLDPDGTAAGTRLNDRGVDLNRNFPSGWEPIGSPGDPEYSGPRPLSEPESRLAARIVNRVRPEATVWFHQIRSGGPFVRAWGGSVAAARRFAALAGLPFRELPWPAGTAPNWQNHRFPGSASFVVETPRGPLPNDLRYRLERAMVYLAREAGRD